MLNKKTIRQNEIIDLLRTSPTLRVKELAEKLDVTSETIRRDFDDLNNKGLLKRTYGGAILPAPQEPGLHIRHQLLVKEREAIAREVVREIKGSRHIMLGSGATTTHVARYIAAELNNITVIVHSFGAALELSHNPTIRVLMVPGFYSALEGANHGAHTVQFLDKFWVDYAVLGASGLSPEGPSDALIDAGEVYTKMISRSAQTILAVDKSKFNMKFSAHYASWRDVDYLITDGNPEGDLLDNLKSAQTVIVQVSPRRI